MSKHNASNVRVRHRWSDKVEQLQDLRPRTGFALLLDWTFETDPVDACVPTNVQTATATALARLGPVAFRCDEVAGLLPGEADIIPPADRGYVRDTLERLTNRWAATVVVSRQATVVRSMFDFDWQMQGQAALVLADGQSLPVPLRSELATRRSWIDFTFTPPSLALLLPSVDGDGVLFAASTQTVLDGFLAGLKGVLGEAGVPVTEAA